MKDTFAFEFYHQTEPMILEAKDFILNNKGI